MFSRDIAISYLTESNKKITHILFSSDEYIYNKNGKIYDEAGYVFEDWITDGYHNGIRIRTEQCWDTGWDFYK